MSTVREIGIILLLALLAIGCQRQKDPETGNAVYYWRTDLRLDSTERVFLSQYHINKVYCRFFDVVMDSVQGPRPNATITFSDTLPEGIELVPTIYITEDCMHEPHEGLAEKIVSRILQMNETNGIGNIREIQIDCDYTDRSRKTYYQFLNSLGTVLSEFSTEDSLKTVPSELSTTIRLHQLTMPAPPVDYGVLMLYNTGDPRKFEERNPILDIRDVAPYLKRLDKYDLPLAAAYPVYSWLRIIDGVHIEHTVEAGEILKVKHAVEQKREGLKNSIITYHLDKENINRYKPETYEEIYHH